MNVQAEDNADQDRLSNDYEESKNNEGIDTDTNPCTRRKQRKKQEAVVIRRNILQNNYPEMVDKFERDFDRHMSDLFKHLTMTKRYAVHIANLSQRLDYNGWITNRLISPGQHFTIEEHQM